VPAAILQFFLARNSDCMGLNAAELEEATGTKLAT
jgi:hypothetical protein